jgi:hypothetical protein
MVDGCADDDLNQSQIVAASIMPALGAIALDGLRKSDVDIWVGERLAPASQ